MAAALTYSSLLTDVLAYAERTDDSLLNAQLPRLVMLAENRVATDLKVRGSLKVVTGSFEVLGVKVPKPTFWRDTVSFQVTGTDGRKFNLFPRTYEYCRNYWPDSSMGGTPRFYADYGFDHYLVVPPPSTALGFELTYHTRLDPLDADNQTNWVTVNAPQLLFYALMTEVQMYLKNEDKIAMWGNMYKDSIDGLSKEDSGRRDDSTTVPK